MRLADISGFGGIDADADELLDRCFQDHPAYLNVLEHERFLIIGRKGSGKTAIFKRLLKDKDPAHFCFGYTFDDYPWVHHDLQAQQGVPEERRYVHSWKYLALMGTAKLLMNCDHSQPWSDEAADALAILEDFIVDSYGSRDPDLTQLFSPEKELKIKAGLHLKFLDISGERVKVRDLPVHVQDVNRRVGDCVLKALNPENRYYICFDQLDLGLSTTDPKYAHRLIGLILAGRDLNIMAREAGKRFSVVIFLRDDIYKRLQFEDKNKITENHLSRIAWDQPRSEFTLKHLMERRFKEVLDDDASWETLFDEDKEMPSRQSKYAHMRDRTFLRPRDMIKFCNLVLAAYKAREGELPERFTNEDVINARAAYSQYLLAELADEIHKHVPHYEEYLEIIKTIGRTQFTKEQFIDRWNQRPALADSDTHPEAALEELFEFSVVGYLKTGGGGGGSSYVWRYIDPSARFSPDASTFRVHPGFKEALDLAKGLRE